MSGSLLRLWQPSGAQRGRNVLSFARVGLLTVASVAIIGYLASSHNQRNLGGVRGLPSRVMSGLRSSQTVTQEPWNRRGKVLLRRREFDPWGGRGRRGFAPHADRSPDVLEKEDVKVVTSSTPDSAPEGINKGEEELVKKSSTPSSESSLSALDSMLGGDDFKESQIPIEPVSETKAKHALDLLSGWFGPDEAEIEAQKEKEERKRDQEERERKAKEAEFARRNNVPAVEVTIETEDERLPDEVMRVLGLGKGSNQSAEILLEDLKEKARTGDERDRELMEAVTSFLESAQSENATENELRNDFINLLDKLQPENRVDIDDMKKIQKEILGPNTFYVTTSDIAAKFDGVFGLRDVGYVFCGNFRGDQEKMFEEISERVQKEFDGKYEVFLIPDPELEIDPFYDGDTNKAALQILPADRAQPPEGPKWGIIAALALFAITSFGALQLGAQAASVQLPAATIQWLSNPENFQSYDPQEWIIPPGIRDWDPTPFLASVGQVAAGAITVQLIHELGHRISAAFRGVRLGSPFFLPLGSLPTSFGSITPFRSLVKNNKDLFDISAAGPLSGVIMASILFIAGLVLTGQTPQGSLVAVPYPFVQQSLLLGTMVKACLGIGDGALTSDALLVHPLVVAGWVGLVAQAFNSLPVGSVDGGRMVQATFGSGPLGFTSLLTYAALGFGLIGGPVDGLVFGLYLLFLQRTSEKYIQDTVTLAEDKPRRAISLALVIFAALVLTPLG